MENDINKIKEHLDNLENEPKENLEIRGTLKGRKAKLSGRLKFITKMPWRVHVFLWTLGLVILMVVIVDIMNLVYSFQMKWFDIVKAISEIFKDIVIGIFVWSAKGVFSSDNSNSSLHS